MASKWIDAAVQKKQTMGKKGSFRNLGQQDDHGEPDADDKPRKKKKPGFVASLNEPEAY